MNISPHSLRCSVFLSTAFLTNLKLLIKIFNFKFMQNLPQIPSVNTILSFGNSIQDPDERQNLMQYLRKNTLWRQEDKDNTTLLEYNLIDAAQLSSIDPSKNAVDLQENYSSFVLEPPRGCNPFPSLSSVSLNVSENSLSQRSPGYKRLPTALTLARVPQGTYLKNADPVYEIQEIKCPPKNYTLDEAFNLTEDVSLQTEHPLRPHWIKHNPLNIPSLQLPITKSKRHVKRRLIPVNRLPDKKIEGMVSGKKGEKKV